MKDELKNTFKTEFLDIYEKVKKHPIKSIFFGAVFIWLFKKFILKPILK